MANFSLLEAMQLHSTVDYDHKVEIKSQNFLSFYDRCSYTRLAMNAWKECEPFQ